MRLLYFVRAYERINDIQQYNKSIPISASMPWIQSNIVTVYFFSIDAVIDINDNQ